MQSSAVVSNILTNLAQKAKRCSNQYYLEYNFLGEYMKIPLWLRITIAAILAALLLAVIFIGGKMLLDIWAEAH